MQLPFILRHPPAEPVIKGCLKMEMEMVWHIAFTRWLSSAKPYFHYPSLSQFGRQPAMG
jgi:hypothetical protein